MPSAIKVGVYFFSQAITTEELMEEANLVLEKIAPYKIECPVVYDVEKTSKDGVKKGLLVSFVFSLFQLGQGIMDGLFTWGLTPAMLIGSILLDYVFAYTAIGIGGMFRNKGVGGWIAGTVIAGLARFVSHFLSGVVIWHSFGQLWDGFSTDNEWLYSLVYNGAYMLPEIVFTVICAVILFNIPQTRKLITGSEKAA